MEFLNAGAAEDINSSTPGFRGYLCVSDCVLSPENCCMLCSLYITWSVCKSYCSFHLLLCLGELLLSLNIFVKSFCIKPGWRHGPIISATPEAETRGLKIQSFARQLSKFKATLDNIVKPYPKVKSKMGVGELAQY